VRSALRNYSKTHRFNRIVFQAKNRLSLRYLRLFQRFLKLIFIICSTSCFQQLRFLLATALPPADRCSNIFISTLPFSYSAFQFQLFIPSYFYIFQFTKTINFFHFPLSTTVEKIKVFKYFY